MEEDPNNNNSYSSNGSNGSVGSHGKEGWEGETNQGGSIDDLATVAADSTPLGKEREEQKKRFESFCYSLNVDHTTRVLAWELLCRIPSEDITPDNETTLTACALYVAGRTAGKGHGPNLTQLLKEAHLRIIDFFDPLRSFLSIVQLGPAYEEHLKLLEKKFVVTTILFQKYEKVFEHLLHVSPNVPEHLSEEKKYDLEQVFSFGWTLFLVSKGKLLSDPPDLLNAFHVLLCCLSLLYIHAPAEVRKISLETEGSTSEDLAATSLQHLCQLFSALYADVLKVHEQLFMPFLLMLRKNEILKLSDTAVPKNFNFAGLLDTYLQQNKQNINKEYDIMYYDSGDLDERVFIDNKHYVGTPSKVGTQTRNYFHLRSKSQSGTDQAGLTSPYKNALLSSPQSNVPPSSPMSTTLSIINYFKNILLKREAKPSVTLLRFFAACDKDVTDSIVQRVERLSATLRTGDVNTENQRIDLGTKLYYRLLESMLLAEEQRLKQDNFTTLLTHENFHRSLLACCMEIILFSYKVTQMCFPFVLQRFQIKAFDFCKIIESVVRHEPEMPRMVVKHLSSIEEKILESLAWEEGSPLLTLLQDKSNQLGIMNTLLSPASNNNNKTAPGLVSPGMNKTETGSKSHSLELFFRKVLQLASIRSRELCCRLQISPRIFQQVWQGIVHVLTEKTHIMTNRHLDQIVMCTLYGVCRVNQLKDVTFKNIIEQYKMQPQASSKVFREVVLHSPETADIITFYNSIFIPTLESFLLQFQANKEEENNVITSPNKYSSFPHSPKVITNMNLYISPMRGSRNPLAAVPNENSGTSKWLYSVGESPARQLQSINDTLNTWANRSKSKPKRLFMNDNTDENNTNNETTPLKRRHEDTESQQQRVESD